MSGTEEGGLAGEGAALARVLRLGSGVPGAAAAAPSAALPDWGSPSSRRDLARKVFLGGKGVGSRSLSDLGERARPSSPRR